MDDTENDTKPGVIELYAWIGKSTGIALGDEGEWGIMTLRLPGLGNSPLPLVAKQERVARLMEEFVRMSVGHTEIQLVRFVNAEVIEKLR